MKTIDQSRRAGVTDVDDGRPRLPQALGKRIDVLPVVESLRPLIVASETQMEKDGELPRELADAMHDAGIFYAIHPRELGGRELHPHDWMELLFELSRINGSVGWIAMIQSGVAPLLAPELMRELYDRAGGRFIASGSHGRIGKAYRVAGGYRFTGQWAFASGAPWATHLTAYAHIIGDDGEPLTTPQGTPLYIDGIFAKEDVNYIGGWNSMGLRGTGSGQFSLDDVFVEHRFTTQGMPHEAYTDRALFRSAAIDQGQSAVVLGIAQGAIDKFVELSHRPKRTDSWANRAAGLGDDQSHQIKVAQADALIRSARYWAWELAERKYNSAFSKDGEAQFELTVEGLECGLHTSRSAAQATSLIFGIAGTDSVIVGRGIERCFRDVHTAAQHTLVLENNFEVPGQYYLTRDQPGGPKITSPNSLLPPPPRTGDNARLWLLDELHSTVAFRVRHHAAGTFRGYFSEFEAAYDSQAGKLTGSTRTGSLNVFDTLKEHLLTGDFLDAEEHPTISFESTSIRIEGDNVTVEGDLTLRGITKPVTATGTIAGPSKVEGFSGPDTAHLGLDLTTAIDRRDFGIDFNNELLDGQLNLGWEVTLEFSLEFSSPVQAEA